MRVPPWLRPLLQGEHESPPPSIPPRNTSNTTWQASWRLVGPGWTHSFFSNHCSILRRLDMTRSRWMWNIFELGPLQLKIAGKVAESMWQLCLGYSLRLNKQGRSLSLTRGVRMQKRGQAMHWTFAWPKQWNAKWRNEVYLRYDSLRLNRWRIFGCRSRANVPFPHVPQAAQSPIQFARGTASTSRWKRVILDTTGSFAYLAWDILVALRTTQTMIFTNLLWEHDRFLVGFSDFVSLFLALGPRHSPKRFVSTGCIISRSCSYVRWGPKYSNSARCRHFVVPSETTS